MDHDHLTRTWKMFIFLIADDEKEKRLLTKLYHKQLHRINNYNKEQLA